MSDAPATKLCSVCGNSTGDDPHGVMVVRPDGSATGKVTYYCGEHNSNPPTPEQLVDRERQEMEAAAAFVRSQEELIRQLIDLDRPVTAVDRANIGTLLLGMHQRLVALANEMRQMQGKEPIPLRPPAAPRPPPPRDAGGTEPEQPVYRPQYRMIVRHLWEPSIDEQIHPGMDVRFVDVIEAVQEAGARFSSGSPGEHESSVTFYAPSDDVVERVRRAVEIPGRHQATMLQYLPDFPRGAPLTIWRR